MTRQTVRRTVPLLARVASVIALGFIVAACGSTTGSTNPATSCNTTKAAYIADNTAGATVKGGMGGNLNPSMKNITGTFETQQPPIGGSSTIGGLLPADGTAGVICANGDIYKDGHKVATDAVFVDRTPSASIVMVDDQEFYQTPVTKALKAAHITACPALVWVTGLGTPFPLLKAICLDNDNVVYKSKPEA